MFQEFGSIVRGQQMIKLFDLHLSFGKDASISGKHLLGLCRIMCTRTQKLKNFTHILMTISIHEIKCSCSDEMSNSFVNWHLIHIFKFLIRNMMRLIWLEAEDDAFIIHTLELFCNFCDKFSYHTENNHNQNMVDSWCYMLIFEVQGLRMCFSQINSQFSFLDRAKYQNFT